MLRIRERAIEIVKSLVSDVIQSPQEAMRNDNGGASISYPIMPLRDVKVGLSTFVPGRASMSGTAEVQIRFRYLQAKYDSIPIAGIESLITYLQGIFMLHSQVLSYPTPITTHPSRCGDSTHTDCLIESIETTSGIVSIKELPNREIVVLASIEIKAKLDVSVGYIISNNNTSFLLPHEINIPIKGINVIESDYQTKDPYFMLEVRD